MSDALESWNDTPTRQAIVEFVQRVTREGGADYLPPAERVAVFDNDGTLWCEKPMPIELGFVFARLAEMADKDGSLRDRQPWKAACERDFEWLGAVITKHYHGDDSDVKVLMGGILHAYAGMTIEEFTTAAEAFLRREPPYHRPQLPRLRLPADDRAAALPRGKRVHLLHRLRRRPRLHAPVTEENYGIPAEHVIGSSKALRYQHDESGGSLVYLAEPDVFDDGAKPVRSGIVSAGAQPWQAATPTATSRCSTTPAGHPVPACACFCSTTTPSASSTTRRGPRSRSSGPVTRGGQCSASRTTGRRSSRTPEDDHDRPPFSPACRWSRRH